MTVIEIIEFSNTLQQALASRYTVIDLCIESDFLDAVQVRIAIHTPGHGVVQCHVPFSEIENATVESMISQIVHFLAGLGSKEQRFRLL